MPTIQSEQVPKPGESLAFYARRVRTELGMSQVQVAQRAGIHLQSLGKIEAGKTNRLAAKTKTGLAKALQVPQELSGSCVPGSPSECSATVEDMS